MHVHAPGPTVMHPNNLRAGREVRTRVRRRGWRTCRRPRQVVPSSTLTLPLLSSPSHLPRLPRLPFLNPPPPLPALTPHTTQTPRPPSPTLMLAPLASSRLALRRRFLLVQPAQRDVPAISMHLDLHRDRRGGDGVARRARIAPMMIMARSPSTRVRESSSCSPSSHARDHVRRYPCVLVVVVRVRGAGDHGWRKSDRVRWRRDTRARPIPLVDDVRAAVERRNRARRDGRKTRTCQGMSRELRVAAREADARGQAVAAAEGAGIAMADGVLLLLLLLLGGLALSVALAVEPGDALVRSVVLLDLRDAPVFFAVAVAVPFVGEEAADAEGADALAQAVGGGGAVASEGFLAGSTSQVSGADWAGHVVLSAVVLAMPPYSIVRWRVRRAAFFNSADVGLANGLMTSIRLAVTAHITLPITVFPPVGITPERC